MLDPIYCPVGYNYYYSCKIANSTFNFQDVNLDTLKSTISEDGILTIKADIKFAEKEIEIKIDKSSE